MFLGALLLAALLLLGCCSEDLGGGALVRSKRMEFDLSFPFSTIRFKKGNPTIELIKRLPLDFWSLFSRRQ
uniref:Secreted protein n=1 Tax=Steinernema glaseri TaxID=37863 RepID=A0A1I7Z1R8_9BILA